MSNSENIKTEKANPREPLSRTLTQTVRGIPKKTAIHEVKIFGPDGELKKIVPAIQHKEVPTVLTRSSNAKTRGGRKGISK